MPMFAQKKNTRTFVYVISEFYCIQTMISHSYSQCKMIACALTT